MEGRRIFFGFDDFMKAAKQKDAGLYQTAEEKEAAEKAAKQKEKAPALRDPRATPAPALRSTPRPKFSDKQRSMNYASY